MPNYIEQGYLDQGYALPEGWTWDRVNEHRARWNVDAILMPIVVAHGCVGWGVPIINDAFPKHPTMAERNAMIDAALVVIARAIR